jgi:hypothetical protein
VEDFDGSICRCFGAHILRTQKAVILDEQCSLIIDFCCCLSQQDVRSKSTGQPQK